MKTKEKIVITAIELFNELGVNKVSTNTIAMKSEISTGNLYYHYKNKEEIIQSIFINLKKEHDKIWKTSILSKNFQDAIDDYINEMFKIHKIYNFFYIELFSLILKDKILKQMYQNFFLIEKTRLSLLIQKGITEKVIKDITDDEVEQFTEDFLKNFQYWSLLGNLENCNTKYTTISSLKEWLYLIISPYLKNSFYEEVEKK